MNLGWGKLHVQATPVTLSAIYPSALHCCTRSVYAYTLLYFNGQYVQTTLCLYAA